MEELDPAKCKAIDSSIWEIHALSRHYWTGAIKQSRIFTERLTKPAHLLLIETVNVNDGKPDPICVIVMQ